MKAFTPTRYTVQCLDGKTRFVFCRSINSSSPLTGSQIIPTEDRAKAFSDYNGDSLNYFTTHANGAPIKLTR